MVSLGPFAARCLLAVDGLWCYWALLWPDVSFGMLTVRRVFGTIFQSELSFLLLTASGVIWPIYSLMCLFGMLKAHGELGPFTAQHILRVGRGEEAERSWQGGDTRRARSCWRGLKTLAPPGVGRDTSRT